MKFFVLVLLSLVVLFGRTREKTPHNHENTHTRSKNKKERAHINEEKSQERLILRVMTGVDVKFLEDSLHMSICQDCYLNRSKKRNSLLKKWETTEKMALSTSRIKRTFHLWLFLTKNVILNLRFVENCGLFFEIWLKFCSSFGSEEVNCDVQFGTLIL